MAEAPITTPTATTDNADSKTEEMEPTPSAHTEAEVEAPDPGEDDLDDLDDMLDEFSATSIAGSGPGRPSSTSDPTKASSTKSPSPPTTTDDAPDSAEFSAQLQKEMAALLGEIDESPEMRRQLDELVGELTAGAERALQEDDEKKGVSTAGAPATHSAPNPSTAAPAEPEPNFTDTIRRTMERMAASSSSATAAAAAGTESMGGSEEDTLAQLMKEMGGGGEGGAASEEEFSKMLLGMMEQLTNKEILYEPMKELDGKFPKWIEENEGKVDGKEMERYKEQQGLVREIVGRFESKGYSDQNAQDREFVVERMQKMQAAGSPPADLVGDMGGAQEMLGGLGPDCPQQ